MLEYEIATGGFGAVAHDIFAFRSMSLSPKELENYLAPLMDGLKGEALYTARLDTFLVTPNGDGTSSAAWTASDNGNPYWLKDLLINSGTTAMVANRQTGDALCIAPVEINGAKYYHFFKPEEAPALRQQLTEALNEKFGPVKEPSRYDRFCNWCAEKFLKRPGKAVAEYNARKAFSDSMEKLINDIADIPKKVDEFKQSKEEAKRLEAERLKEEELERQRQIELEKERARQAEEDRKRQIEEEKLRKAQEEEQRLKEQMLKEKEANIEKHRPERDKAALEAERKANEFRLQMARSLLKSIPRKIEERDNNVKQRAKLAAEIEKGEKDLLLVKNDLTKKQQWLKTSQDDLTKTKNAMNDLKDDLETMEKLKKLQPQKKEQQRNLKAAEDAIPVLKEQLKQAKEDHLKAADEYSKVAGGGHIFVMKPEEYLQYNYNKAKEGREQMLQQDRASLAARMKELDDQIQVRDTSKAQIQSEAKTWDYLPVIRKFRQKAQFMDKEDALKADLKKQYAALQKEDAEVLKAFNEREVQHKALALDFSPENLKRTEEFLQNGLKETKAKYDAFQNAKEREEKLEELLALRNGDRSRARKALDRLNKDSGGMEYDEERHNRTQEVYNNHKEHVTSLNRQIPSMRNDVNEQSLLVRNAEFELNRKKESLPKLKERYDQLNNEIDHEQAQLRNYSNDLHKAGIAVKPDEPELLKQPQAKQPQAQAKQPPKPQPEPEPHPLAPFGMV